MKVAEYQRFDAIGLAELIRERQISESELLDVATQACDERNLAVNAVVTDLRSFARDCINEGLPHGPFRGVPFLIKDLRATIEGFATTQGSRFFFGNVARQDSETVRRYREAGLVIFGKTNTPEFGLAPSTEPQLFGATRNPWDLSRTAGGSSGGAAAAVAAEIVPAAHGSDGGGSLRIPASCCGLFALKPTRGLNPSGPDLGEAWNGLSAEHVISRSVRDNAALLDVTSGPALGDPYASPAVAGTFLEQVYCEPRQLRIGLQLQPASGVSVHPDCVRAAEKTAALLEDLGHHVEEAAPTYDLQIAGSSYRTIIGANVQAAIEEFAEVLGRWPEPGELENVVATRGVEARKLTATALARAVWGLHRTGRAIAPFFDTFDVLVTPTLAGPPVPLGLLDMSTDDIEAYLDNVYRWIPFTAIANITGIPAMSVPMHWNAEGLPIGVQFLSAFGNDGLLIRLAAQLEAAKPWANKRPEF